MPAPVEIKTPDPSSWTLDRRQAIGLALGLFVIGFMLGAKIAGGMPNVVEVPVPVKAAPCADCAERAIQEARRASTGERVEERHAPEFTVPGDSSVPE